MMSYVFVLPAVVLLFLNLVFAAPPRPYVGGSVAVVFISENEKPPPGWDGWCGTPYTHGPRFGQGVALESGFAAHFWDAHGSLSAESASDRWRTVWQSVRLGVGARLRVPDSVKNPVKPFLGAGVTAGWARYQAAHNSKLSAGLFGEIGLMVVTRGNWRPALTFRVDWFNAHLNPGHSTIDGAGYAGLGFALVRLL